MKLLACVPLLLLAGAASSTEVAPGAFRQWKPGDGPAAWTSAGVHVDISPAPCDSPPRTEGCRWDPQNNQAEVTVTAAGAAPITVRTDDQASYYRVAVARLEAGDRSPGIVIVNESGGSGGDVRVQLLVPAVSGYREAVLPGALQERSHLVLDDVSGDGAIDFVLGDGRFGGVFGCNACTPRPPVVLTVRHGVPVDVSREPAYAGVFRADLARVRAACLSNDPERNGACAAYVADAARLGRFDRAWAEMLRAYNRKAASKRSSPDRDYPAALRHFLVRTGYIRG